MDPEDITTARPGGERDLYVALTRATKRLCTITVQPADPEPALAPDPNPGPGTPGSRGPWAEVG
jgi:hypothetical protein